WPRPRRPVWRTVPVLNHWICPTTSTTFLKTWRGLTRLTTSHRRRTTATASSESRIRPRPMMSLRRMERQTHAIIATRLRKRMRPRRQAMT
ncbi:MAG: hypothetical protein AVDCRST_MAG43-801, partial [uncultured Thermomicrobiales bacterium]